MCRVHLPAATLRVIRGRDEAKNLLDAHLGFVIEPLPQTFDRFSGRERMGNLRNHACVKARARHYPETEIRP